MLKSLLFPNSSKDDKMSEGMNLRPTLLDIKISQIRHFQISLFVAAFKAAFELLMPSLFSLTSQNKELMVLWLFLPSVRLKSTPSAHKS